MKTAQTRLTNPVRIRFGSLFFLFVICCSAARAAEQPFDFDALRTRARDMAAIAYTAPAPMPESVDALNYDQYRKILFNTPSEIWKKLPFALQFMHPGYLYHDGVVIHELAGRGVNTVPFSGKYYLYTGDYKPTPEDEARLKFAGFRLLRQRNPGNYEEVISFLGASYFRAVGKDQNFGLSSRGLAVNAIPAGAEEFPAFREFWIERPGSRAKTVKVYALLDGKSVTGAYEFTIYPEEATRVHVKAEIFARTRIESVGIAPLTSMFWYSAAGDQEALSKSRPAVHDSDGLLVHEGKEDWIWHPVSNPAQPLASAFATGDLRGFGLLQRDRNAASYLDTEARYENRPGLWIAPTGKWGQGSVRLLELHTENEYADNVVAEWTPAEPLEAGKSLTLEYDMYWSAEEPSSPEILRVSSSHIARQPDTQHLQITLNFSGDKRVSSIGNDIRAEVKSREGVGITGVTVNKAGMGWNVSFNADVSASPAEITCVLNNGKRTLSEKWHYNFQP